MRSVLLDPVVWNAALAEHGSPRAAEAALDMTVPHSVRLEARMIRDVERVAREREAHEARLSILGTMTDKDAARRLGLGPQAARAERIRRGIPAFCRRQTDAQFKASVERRHPGLVARLGVDSDHDVARTYGICRQRIGQIRKRLGIAAADVSALYARERAPWEPLLGTMMDRDIAERFGVSVGAVSGARRRLGIAQYHPPPGTTGALASFRHLLGTMPDRRIAAMAGVSAPAVTILRQRLGVPVFPGTARNSSARRTA